MSRRVKVHPAPVSPKSSTLVKKVFAYSEARNRGDDLQEYRHDILDHLMNTRKMKPYEDLMATTDGVYTISDSLFFLAEVVWHDERLVKRVISTAKRLDVLDRLRDTTFGRSRRTLYSMAQDEMIIDALERNGFPEGRLKPRRGGYRASQSYGTRRASRSYGTRRA
jgi:hypothetical protein